MIFSFDYSYVMMDGSASKPFSSQIILKLKVEKSLVVMYMYIFGVCDYILICVYICVCVVLC
jgi:hypothetical protein